MFNVTLKILGERLKQVREHLGLSQMELANKVNCKQNAISNIEHGKGGSITLLINLLNFYSTHIYIDMIFSETFILISDKQQEEGQKPNFIAIVADLIKQAHLEHKEQLESAVKSADSKLSENLERAIRLLRS